MSIDLRDVALSVSGQVGQEYIYWSFRGRHFRRPYVVPYDPMTLKQIESRNKLWVVASWWRGLTVEEKSVYENFVKKNNLKMSGYCYFLKKKRKEVTVMVKQVLRGTFGLVDGINVIEIPEIIPVKSSLNYNSYLSGDYDPDKKQSGVTAAYISDSTHLTVHCKDSALTGLVLFTWEVIEYV